MKFSNGVRLGLMCLAAAAASVHAQDNPYRSLLRRLPDSTNAVVVMDVQGVRKALGAESGTTLGATNVMNIPLMASKFVMSAQIDMNQRRHLWSIALVEHDPSVSIQDIAKAENEPVEKLAGYSIVPSPRNAYFVEVSPNLLAIRTPPDRQQLKRWLGYQKSNQFADLTPYLMQATNPTNPALVIMAIDLTDNLDRSAVRRGLDSSQVMAGRPNPPNYDQVADILTSAQGMTLLVQPGNPFNGQLTVNFEANIDPISNFAQQLFIEALQKTGLFVRDFENWQPYIGPNFVQLSGPLSLHSMRRFGTLIKAPVPNQQAAGDPNQSPAQRTLQATQSYWKNIMAMLEELRTEKASNDRAQAGWYDQFADQIDKLTTLNVDPDLVTFGLATAQLLRGQGTTDKGIGLQRGLVQQQGQNQMAGPPAGQGYWGYSGRPQPNFTMQGNQLQDQAKMAQTQLWQQVDGATANIRQRLTQKYMTQF